MSGVHLIKTHRPGIFDWLILMSLIGLAVLPGWGTLVALAQSGAPAPPAPLILTDGQERYPLGRRLELLEDPEKRWTIDDVTSPDLARQFRPSQEKTPVFGFTDSVYWVRVRLRNQTSAIADWRLQQHYANIHYVDLYQPRSDRPGYELKRSGVFVPAASRDFPYFAPAFILSLPPGTDQTLYLRFETGSSMTINLVLWSYPAFVIQAERELLILGLFFGMLLVMIGYHLFLWFSLRDPNYLYYVWFVASCLLFAATYEGIGALYLWPNLVGWQQVAVIYGVSSMLASALFFTTTFLDTRRRMPRWHLVITLFLLGWGLVAVAGLFFSYGSIAQNAILLIVLSPLVSLGAGGVAWRRGYRPARYFVLAWLLFAVSVTALELMRADFLPSNPLTEKGFYIGVTAFVLLWSLGLGDRINLIKREQAETQTALLAAQQEIAVREQAEKMLAKQNRTLQTLYRTTLEIGAELDVATLLPSILEHAVELLEASRGGGIYLYDPDEQLLRLTHGIGINQDRVGVVLQLNEGMAGRVFKSAAPLVINDYTAWEGRVAVLVTWPPSAVLGVPLFLAGQTIGVLGLFANSQRRMFNQEDVNLAQTFAAQVTVALQNARLYQQARQEITERKALEAKLRESEERYRSVVEDQTEVIARLRTDGTFTFVNDVFCRFFGKTRPELMGQAWQPVAVAEDVAEVEAKLSALSPANPVVVIENRVYSGDGEIRWMQFVNRGFFDDQGQLVEIQSVGRDITERRQAELLLQEMNNALQQRLLELTIIQFIGQTLTTVVDIQAALDKVVHIVNRFFNAHATSVSIVDPVSKEMKIITSHDLHGSDLATNAPANDEQVIVTPVSLFTGRRLQERRPPSGLEIQTSPALSSVPQLFRACCHTQEFLFAPLQVHGEMIGLLTLAIDRPEHDFTPAEEHIAETVADQMAGAVKIAQLFTQERRQAQLAESLRQVATVLGSSLDRATILKIIFEQLRQVLQYDGAAIGLIANEELVFVQVIGQTTWQVHDRLPLKNDNVLTQVLQQRQVIILPNVAEAESWPRWFRPHESGCWMGAPLGVGRFVFGVLTIKLDQIEAYRQENAKILQTFANQAALAIENTRLYELAQTMAIDAERQRLARELHDSVTQSLYSLTLFANGWAAMAERGESNAAVMVKQFKHLEEISLQALKEMRLLLHQLRPPILEEVGLVGALQQRLDSVEQRVKVETRLLVQGEVDELPRALIDQLYAIAQESLTNILRHAQATEVIVLLRREDGRLTMAVTDNGVGFDPAMPSFGLGLESIRERTEAIGGQLEITSAPGQGTTVMVTVALRPQEGV